MMGLLLIRTAEGPIQSIATPGFPTYLGSAQSLWLQVRVLRESSVADHWLRHVEAKRAVPLVGSQSLIQCLNFGTRMRRLCSTNRSLHKIILSAPRGLGIG